MTKETTPEIVAKVPVKLTKEDLLTAKYRLESLLQKLYINPSDRFYNYLFFQVGRHIVGPDVCPTMGVGMQKGKLKLVINPVFLAKLTDYQAIEILKHEAMHLINEHIARGQGAKEKDMVKHRMENISQDCAINQYLDAKVIDDIGGISLEKFRGMLTHKDDSFVLEPLKTAEYYMSHLEQEKNHRDAQKGDSGDSDENGEQGQGSGGGSLEKELEGFEMDDHGMFGEMDALDQAMLEHNIKTAVENAKGDGAGKLPSEVEEMLKLKKKPTVSWKRELRQFIGAGVRAETRTTRSKRNRRYGIIQPGYKRDHIAKILVVLDTSGSMYGDRTDKVLSELYGIFQATPNLQLDVVECDAQIQEVFTYNGKDELKITGRGGTQMTPGLIYARENKYDGVIFLTDGEFWDEDFESNDKVKSLWVIADNASYTSPIGKTIHLKSN